jgi:hypothetical protein
MQLFVLWLSQFFDVANAANLRRPAGYAVLSGSPVEHFWQRRHAALHQKSSPSLKITLQNHRGIQYTAPVYLGNQELHSIYDTGSFEVMAIADDCSVCKLDSAQHAYNDTSSETFRQGGHGTEDHHFAGGIVKAREDYETVAVGELESPIRVEGMPFWQVVKTDMKVFLNEKAHFTAIVGLGHRVRRLDSDTESLVERAGIDKFSICLLPGLANPGYLTFNPAHNLGNAAFKKLAVIGENHWAVSMDHAQTDLNGTPLHSCWVYGGQQSCVAIIDSGTSLIGVPPNAVVMIQTLIKRIRYDCSNLDELPDLVFTLDGRKFPLPARAYTVHFGMVDGKPSRCLPAFTDVSMSLKGSNVWILGVPFLRHFYTVFDRAGPSIYVADQADDCEPALAGNSAFIDSSPRKRATPSRLQHPPTIADLSEARLPSWAYGDKDMQL